MEGILRPARRKAPAATAVLFDMDGLLIDSEPVWERSIDAFCRRRGRGYGHEDAAVCQGRGIAFTAEYLASKHGWAADVAAHVAEICADFAAAVPAAPECPGAGELLRSLRGRWPLGLGSSTARPLAEAALGGRGWLPMFDAVVTGSEAARLKPAPDIYLAVAQRLGQPPEQCVVFEDSAAGCQAAMAAGMFVVAIRNPSAPPGPPPDADMAAVDLRTASRALGLVSP